MTVLLPTPTCVVALVLAAAPTSAQVLLHSFEDPFNGIGSAVAGVGDVDGDGHDDVLIGAPEEGLGGAAWIVSGADGAVLFEYEALELNVQLGSSGVGLGDVNGDGTPDFALGIPVASGARGCVRVHSGLDGAELYTVCGPPDRRFFGTELHAGGDLDGDGIADLVTSGWSNALGGVIVACSGVDGAYLHDVDPPGPGSFPATGVAGDVDGDGFDDFLVGYFNENGGTGLTNVHSGADGTVLRTHTGQPGEFLGLHLEGLGDVDLDGYDDYAIGAATSSLRIFSGQAGEMLYAFPLDGADLQGVSGRGHLDGDGLPDFLVATDAGVLGCSGPDGQVLFRHSDPLPVASIRRIALAGDVDAAGPDDFVVGDFRNGPPAPGEARIYATCYSENYCVGAPNSVGPGARISVNGSLSIAENNLRLEAFGVVPDEFAVFFHGPVQLQLPFGDGFRCVGGEVFRLEVFSTGSTGTPTYLIDFEGLPGGGEIQPGETRNFQCWYRDPGGAGLSGFNLSDALEVLFCP